MHAQAAIETHEVTVNSPGILEGSHKGRTYKLNLRK